GSGTSGVTEPCVPELGFTSRFTCRSPTLTPELRRMESAIVLWVFCTTAPLEMSMATPPERKGPLPVPRAPTSPPFTGSGALCSTMLLAASKMKSLVFGAAFRAAVIDSVGGESGGGAPLRQATPVVAATRTGKNATRNVRLCNTTHLPTEQRSDR